ncbi:hypothetical protein ACFWY6_19105, partial [Streptomyces sp. NPDC059037]
MTASTPASRTTGPGGEEEPGGRRHLDDERLPGDERRPGADASAGSRTRSDTAARSGTEPAPLNGSPSPEAEGPAESASPTDDFDQDTLPTAPGATAALLRSLLAPLRRRVVLATVLLLLQQAAVQGGPRGGGVANATGVPAGRPPHKG